MIKKTFSILAASAILFLNNNAIAADDFYIKKGNQFELCKEVKQVLDDPENKSYADPYIKNPEFKIPKKYKNFALPKWEDISVEEGLALMKEGKTSKKITAFNKGEEFGNLNPKKYGITDKFIMQKATIDFDHDGNKDTMLRYRMNGDNIVYDHNWSCYIADANREDASIFQSFNQSYLNDRCYLFYYKGKIFHSYYGETYFMIQEPRSSRIPAMFGLLQACEIEMTTSKSKAASKVSHEYYKKGGKWRDELKKLEEAAKAKNNQDSIKQNIN